MGGDWMLTLEGDHLADDVFLPVELKDDARLVLPGSDGDKADVPLVLPGEEEGLFHPAGPESDLFPATGQSMLTLDESGRPIRDDSGWTLWE